MIIFAPRQQLREPAAEKGPEWSNRTPILIVCPCASARGAHVLAPATASTSAAARIIRADFISGPPRKKWGAGYHAPVRRARISNRSHGPSHRLEIRHGVLCAGADQLLGRVRGGDTDHAHPRRARS